MFLCDYAFSDGKIKEHSHVDLLKEQPWKNSNFRPLLASKYQVCANDAGRKGYLLAFKLVNINNLVVEESLDILRQGACHDVYGSETPGKPCVRGSC